MKAFLERTLLARMGIRSKLITLFIAIKVVPLVLLALVAWRGVAALGDSIAEQTDTLSTVVRDTVDGMGKNFSSEAEKALDRRAQEELERLTTDTARAIADFLHERDEDILQAARLDTTQNFYQLFISGRARKVVAEGQWALAEDGKSWVEKQGPAKAATAETVTSGNAENQQDFHYRLPENVQKTVLKPLYHEITFVGLDGQEKIKVSATNVLPRDLRNVSRRENTWAHAETYFNDLKKLKPGEIYVSEVVGPYTGSRVIGPLTPEKAKSLDIPFEPEKEAYAGRENPLGKKFQGIVRWATPVVRGGKITGYVTLALDHSHIMSFTDHLMPSDERYARIADASKGNYAFIWDHKDRNIAHPRHHSIVGFDPKTGEYAAPWLEASIYDGWQQSGKSLKDFLATQPIFDGQTREKKPAKPLTKAGNVGLDCRYLNFAPQCQGWHELTEKGGSGSFLILWTGVWKLTTAAAIPYHTGQYTSPRGFGYVTIGANIDDYHKPAQETARMMAGKVAEFGENLKQRQAAFHQLIADSLGGTAASLTVSTVLMVALVVAIAIWLASAFTRRIKDITTGLQRIEKGDFSFRFTKHSQDEVGQLTDSLNTMADGVQESFRRLEDAKSQAEVASRLKSDFLARMSHELRTPLNGILGFSELIKDSEADAETREHAGAIHSSGERLLGMVNDVLDLAKMESGHMVLEPDTVELGSLLETVARRFAGAAQEKGLHTTLDIAANTTPTLRTDRRRVEQALDKLYDNAIKFTAAGTVGIAARNADGGWIIEVSDSGPGIPEADRPNLFTGQGQLTHFDQRAHEGAGLGLALVRENLHLLGGKIELDENHTPGSCFRVTIPALAD